MKSQDDMSNQDEQKKLADLEQELNQKADLKKGDKAASDTTTAPRLSTTAEPKKAEQPSKPVRTTGLWIFSIFQLLLLLAVAGAAVWFYLQWQNNESTYQQQIDTQQQRLQSHITQSKTQLDRMSEQQGALQNTIASMLDDAKRNETLAESLRQRLNELSGRRPADWLLAEADYLLRMAGRKLWLEQDIRTSVLLLQSADSRLADLADPSLLPVRALIAEDIQSLQQINPVSLSSIALSISGLIPQVANLPLDTIKLPESVETQQDTEVSDSVSDWRENLRKVWHSIVDDFVKVTQRDAPVQPFMAEQQQWLVKEQLKHALSQAQTAVLKGQEAVYQQALQQSLAVIVEHFDIQAANVDQFVAALQNLKQTNISKTYPQQFKSQPALRDVLEQRMQGAFGQGAQSL
ncbi:uroporphyrinogen-III C-methyltransferase [Aestuariibacter salexigens]|uniref:uroporphyrinogen-III C-methyltransferase n=1 Tax=Aestuariibacter salexigens TaxID=226010 RepID=UPI0004095E04|nr:uroporphyrinogen-III C-methyltransferase [Aestuariibacter salexigens]